MPVRVVPFPKGGIGPKFTRRVVPWVENFWHQHKRYPTDAELCTQFGWSIDQIKLLHSSKFYKMCLKERGITLQQGFFTEQQIAALALITNFADNRPPDAKLASIGVTPEMYHGWQQNPDFMRELANRADDVLDHLYPEANAMLAKHIRNGNFNALKFYFEITGRAQSPEAINVKMTMARLIEAVQKHVKDPAILAAIASELQGVAPVAASIEAPAIPSTALPKVVTR